MTSGINLEQGKLAEALKDLKIRMMLIWQITHWIYRENQPILNRKINQLLKHQWPICANLTTRCRPLQRKSNFTVSKRTHIDLNQVLRTWFNSIINWKKNGRSLKRLTTRADASLGKKILKSKPRLTFKMSLWLYNKWSKITILWGPKAEAKVKIKMTAIKI